ncbi:hypothetical protein PC114_g8410 [Phytophthora cactorum]|uniref:TIR domain-containing protein n=1 Tax=Phytophthora cactorum TaxID=29920 RepID=A0A8T1E1Z4_9STRA|nr:hypothetical protein PC114_g8410 [Phytophthora cactorum]KAG2928984.1 hypothetical protein PC115_g7040 [Phytophthora cactorum]KAG2945539.1 hypothetical protein PC117_g8356 [Phytophthora cactorum]KAG3090412.1 hypothetical protein PC122_g7471 [Phytophthora cactorum]KAG3176543.1 hypothetical protein C6341_g8917 [Phytophthora cactorum]
MEATSPARMASAELRATVSTLPVLDEQSSSDSDSDVELSTKSAKNQQIIRKQSNNSRFLLLPRSSSLGYEPRRPLAETGDPCMLAASESDEVTSLDALESEKSEQNQTQDEVDIVVDQEDAPRPQTSLSIGSQPSYESSSFASGLELVSTAERESIQLVKREILRPPQRSGLPEVTSSRGEEGNRGGPTRRKPVPYAWMLAKVGQKTRRKIGDIRNSYFAGWLVACSLFVVLLNTFAIAIVQLTYDPEGNVGEDADTRRQCRHWLKAKDKRMIRRPYLLFCEMIVAIQLGFMMYVAVNQLLNVPVIVDCHSELKPRQIVLFYSAAVLWLVLLRQIIVFCRFLTHLKLQADSSNDSSHTSAFGNWFRALKALPIRSERTRLVKEFKKLLYRAVARGDVLTVETLLSEAESKYRINRMQDLYKPPVLWLYAFAKSRKNPLHIAVKRGNIRIVELLLEHGMDVNVLDKVVRVNFNVGLVFKIISRILVRTQDGLPSPLKAVLCSVLLPPLHGAVAEGYVDIVRLLISKANGANFLQVASVSLTGLIRTYATPLQQSTFTLRSDLSDYLLECGGDVALTPLHEAAATDNVGKIKWLLARGIRVDTLGERVEGVHRRTPLHWAAVVGKVNAAKLLLKKGANPNAKDRDGRTPLHWAARNNHEEVVSLLLAYNAHPDAADDEGIPVVCFAAEAEGVESSIFSNLVAAGASLRTQVSGGNTALHIALQRENRQTAVSLIKCGSSMMITNDSGKRAVDCTTSTELQFLLKKEAGTRKIMISYTHTHAQFASKVREHLETQEQLTCWMDTMDPSGIGGGAVWREEIARGIHNCSLVLSIVCDGYTKSEWCLKELALAKLLRKPVLGLIVEEDHPASMASLESLIPYKNRIPFNDFIIARRQESPRTVIFDIDDDTFARRWQVTRPLMISIMKDGRQLDKEERENVASIVPRRRRRRRKARLALIEQSEDLPSTDDEAIIASGKATQKSGGQEPLLVYSPLGAASSLRVRVKADLEGFGFPCRDLDETRLVQQMSTCRAVVLLVEVPASSGEKGSDEAKASRLVRKQLIASMTRIVTAAQTVSPRRSVYPVLVQSNFLDLSKMYTLARSELFYFVDGGGWSRSVARLCDRRATVKVLSLNNILRRWRR